jgi:uncharacterized protein (TIGR00106 family)
MVLLEFSMTPLGAGESVSPFVARCVEIIRTSGLAYELHAMGTIVEGELDEVMQVLTSCFEALAPDCHRITCAAKFDYRQGHSGRIKSKVASVERKLSAVGK